MDSTKKQNELAKKKEKTKQKP
uniref:Uncharacterized protein n=1 Tax=Rhizophora mucronata TaxID=61149 RepID=A0A2P2MKB6_RHIMU